MPQPPFNLGTDPRGVFKGIQGPGGFEQVLSNRAKDIEAREAQNPFKDGSNTPEDLAEYMAPVMGMLGTVKNVNLIKAMDDKVSGTGERLLAYNVIADHPEYGRITIAELFVTKKGKDLYLEEIFPVRGPAGSPTRWTEMTGRNEAGPAAIRSIWRQLIKDNPGVEKVSASRISGARTGPAMAKDAPPGGKTSVSLEVNPFTENLRRPKKPPTVRE